jgi:hypothetical protein
MFLVGEDRIALAGVKIAKSNSVCLTLPARIASVNLRKLSLSRKRDRRPRRTNDIFR